MVDSSFEEARRCPKCEQPGRTVTNRPMQGGSNMLTILCENKKCRWFNTPWVVQIMPDGTVAKPQGHDKFFREIPDRTEEVRAAIDRDLRRQTGQE